MDNVKERIRKLLNLSEDNNAAEGEIENAMRFAQRLMDEHRISKEDMDAHEKAAETENENMNHVTVAGGSGKCSRWEGRLALAIADAIGGVGVYQTGQRTLTTSLGTLKFDNNGNEIIRGCWSFYGEREGVGIAKMTFNIMRKTIASMARLYHGSVYRGEGRSYCEGFVEKLHQRVNDYKRHERDKNTAALVIGEENRARQWLEQTHHIRLRSRTATTGGKHHGGAYAGGMRDGADVDFDPRRRTKLGNKQPKQIT